MHFASVVTVGDSNPLLQLVRQELVLSVQIQLMPLICRYLLGSASYQHSKKVCYICIK